MNIDTMTMTEKLLVIRHMIERGELVRYGVFTVERFEDCNIEYNKVILR